MENVTGAVAAGENFFNRVNEMAGFWSDLETDNLLLLAPRRVGKTSLLRKMCEDAEAHNFTAGFVNVSDCADELSFVHRIYGAVLADHWGDRFWNQIKESWLGRAVDRVEKIGGGGFNLEFRPEGASWTRLGEELAGAISKLERRWLIQIDELPVFVLKLLGGAGPAEVARVREFLYWMRRVRLQYTGVRWMLAGSIGLDTVSARLYIADAINDLHIEKLDAFDAPTADALLQSLAESYGVELGAKVRTYLVRRAGWPVPYYLQLIFHELRCVRGPVTDEDVNRAIAVLLNPSHRNYFDYWRQRLYDELGRPDSEYAITLLNHCCRLADGASRSALKLALAPPISDPRLREDKLCYLLDVLQNDGYLVEAGAGWRFQSPLLRDYWLIRVAPSDDSNA